MKITEKNNLINLNWRMKLAKIWCRSEVKKTIEFCRNCRQQEHCDDYPNEYK